MPDPRDVYKRTFRVTAHPGDDQICLYMRRRETERGTPWRKVYCFRTTDAMSLSEQLQAAVNENLRR